MLGIINEKQITEEQAVQLELEELAPEKFDPEFEFKINQEYTDTPRETYYRPLTREETAALFKKGNTPVTSDDYIEPNNYDFLPREVAERLVREHFEYKTRENKSKKAEDDWVSQKTTESEVKTVSKTKRTKSTKG